MRRSCWRRSPGTRWATRPPPTGPWSARWTWPNPTARCSWFLLHPAPGLLERQARQGTAHAALVAEILGLLAGNDARASGRRAARPLLEPLSESEIRVLRYLPTHLSAPEIARELYVSTNTVKTHMRNLYAKLGVHSRTEAVEAARALGLLAPSAQRG